jgi:hypothetical protein
VDEDEAEAAPPVPDITLEAPALPFPNFELLMATGMDKFAGQTANAGVSAFSPRPSSLCLLREFLTERLYLLHPFLSYQRHRSWPTFWTFRRRCPP